VLIPLRLPKLISWVVAVAVEAVSLFAKLQETATRDETYWQATGWCIVRQGWQTVWMSHCSDESLVPWTEERGARSVCLVVSCEEREYGGREGSGTRWFISDKVWRMGISIRVLRLAGWSVGSLCFLGFAGDVIFLFFF